jgi:hypothetical protein
MAQAEKSVNSERQSVNGKPRKGGRKQAGHLLLLFTVYCSPITSRPLIRINSHFLMAR